MFTAILDNPTKYGFADATSYGNADSFWGYVHEILGPSTDVLRLIELIVVIVVMTITLQVSNDFCFRKFDVTYDAVGSSVRHCAQHIRTGRRVFTVRHCLVKARSGVQL